MTCLGAIAAVSIAVRVHLVAEQPGPFIWLDELAYERMAVTIAKTGQIGILNKIGLSYSPLYSVVLSPIYLLTSSAPRAYAAIKVINVVFMSLTVVPIYGIARYVLPRGISVAVCALSLLAPLMFYTDLVLSENLAYPLFLVAVWAMLRTVRDPRLINDLLLLGAIALACAARLQQVALFPAALTAIVLVAIVRPEGSRVKALRTALARHWTLFGLFALGALFVVLRRFANGGALPLAGRYSNVGTVHAGMRRLLDDLLWHAAEFDLAVAVAPFAAALLATYLLARYRFPARAALFGAVAVSVTTWVLLLVAYDAAAFDIPGAASDQAGALRLHERYLIYLVPLFLIAFAAVLRSAQRIPLRAYVAAAATAALLPLTIPFGTMINNSIVGDSFAMEMFANAGGVYVAIAHARLVALGLGALLGASLLVTAWKPWGWVVPVGMVVATFVYVSSLVHARFYLAANGAAYAGLPARQDWVDRATRGHDAVLIEGGGWQGVGANVGENETVFFNLSISRVYHTCGPDLSPDFADWGATVAGSGSVVDVEGGTGTILSDYAVVPSAFDAQGTVLARDKQAGLVLIEPPTKTVIVPSLGRGDACS